MTVRVRANIHDIGWRSVCEFTLGTPCLAFQARYGVPIVSALEKYVQASSCESIVYVQPNQFSMLINNVNETCPCQIMGLVQDCCSSIANALELQ